jgi:DNA-binding response OmpR family regulator
MDADKASILVVDDEPLILLTVAEILRRDSYAVSCAGSGQEALAAIATGQFDLVLTDLKMNGVDGMAVVAEVRKRLPGAVALVMTGYGSIDTAIQALRLGAYDYLLKPVEAEELKLAVARSLEHRRFSEIEALYRAGTGIAAATDLEELEQAVAAATRMVLGVEKVSLLIAGRDREIELPPRLAAAVDRLQLAAVLRGEAATVCKPGAANSVYALVPGVIAGRTVCVLVAESGQANYEFHASAQRFLRGLAGHAALALDDMRLLAELRQNNHALTVANRKLKELDRLKTQFRVRRRMQRKIEDGATAPPEGLAGKSRSSGLGLAIVKRIVEAHNGYVTVTSKPESGSAFRLILPILHPETGAVYA